MCALTEEGAQLQRSLCSEHSHVMIILNKLIIIITTNIIIINIRYEN